MNTKSILAEDLNIWDIVVIPSSSQTNERRIRVTSTPELNDLMVNAMGVRIKNGVSQQEPIQFGRKVRIDVILYKIDI